MPRPLYLLRLLPQPRFLLVIKMRGKGLEDMAMIIVKPCCLFRSQELPDDGLGVERTEREGLHLQKVAKDRMHVRLDEQRVLMPHAELSGEIDAGLIGDRHPGMQRSRHILHADLMRTLMHIEVRTDTMTGAVEEVQTFAPHRLTRQGIDLRACGAIRKLSQLQLDMSLQHQGIDPPHLLGHGTQRQGTRDIRRAILILRATVEEQQTVRLQWDVCLGVAS